MKKKDWWPLLTSKHPDEIEWSPSNGKNLRAKKKGVKDWYYSNAEKAEYAMTLGYALIANKGERR